MYTIHAICQDQKKLQAIRPNLTNFGSWKQFWKLEATFQPAGGRMIPKRGSEEQISDLFQNNL